MALVKLDTPIKDFVVNVLQGSPAHTAIKVIEYKFTESRFTTSFFFLFHFTSCVYLKKYKVYKTSCPANSYNANLGRTRL